VPAVVTMIATSNAVPRTNHFALMPFPPFFFFLSLLFTGNIPLSPMIFPQYQVKKNFLT
jgi:hypothetical protein